MTPVLAAALVVLAASDPLTTRIAESAAAAQALQGRFDGVWTLRNGAGVVLFIFQISDPPGSVETVQGAWRDPVDKIGPAEFVVEGSGRLRITVESSPPLSFTLTQNRAGSWRGALPGHGVVTLTRGLATPRPPV